MFNFRPIQIPSVTAITAAILLIAGCGGGGGGSGSGTLTANSLGGGYVMDGTWAACYDGGGFDIKETRTITGLSLEGHMFFYSSIGSVCTTNEFEITAAVLAYTISNPLDFGTNGWSDATALTAAPAAQDGVTTIPATPVSTLVDITGTFGGVPVTLKMVFYIDDTDPTGSVIWYRSVGTPAPDCTTGITASEECLYTQNFFIKQ